MGKISDMVILGLFVQKLVGGTRLRGFSLLRRNWYKYGGIISNYYSIHSRVDYCLYTLGATNNDHSR
jgi:hypothetical protein